MLVSLISSSFIMYFYICRIYNSANISLVNTVPSLETDRWKYYNCIIPECCRAVQFFPFVSMCLVLILTKFKLPKTWTSCLRGFVRYRTKVQVSLFEKQKLTSLNIRIASFLSSVAPYSLSCLSVCVLCWYWQNFRVLRLKHSVWGAL
jgi:hypothetical protein